MSTIVMYVPGDEKEVGDVLVSTPPHWVVALGEEADRGEPDILVRVVCAMDDNGDDISEAVAHRIASVLGSESSVSGSES